MVAQTEMLDICPIINIWSEVHSPSILTYNYANRSSSREKLTVSLCQQLTHFENASISL
jgi:hypothetical protein